MDDVTEDDGDDVAIHMYELGRHEELKFILSEEGGRQYVRSMTAGGPPKPLEKFSQGGQWNLNQQKVTGK
eukprot:5775037-Karenia_brevis.AAC.1